MKLDEFIEKYQKADNIYWTLGAGEIQNLLEEAIERIEEMKKIIKISDKNLTTGNKIKAINSN